MKLSQDKSEKIKCDKRKKVAKSVATYFYPDGSLQCDLVELSKVYQDVGNIPERLDWLKACEISYLAKALLELDIKRKPVEPPVYACDKCQTLWAMTYCPVCQKRKPARKRKERK